MRRNLMIGAALLGVLAIGTGCKSKVVAIKQEAKPLVTTVAAIEEKVEQVAEFTSNIEPFKQNNINPSMSVRIDKILVDVGTKVRKGQLLVVMDQTQLNQLSIQTSNLQADYNRLKAVYDAGGISKQQIDQAEANMSVQTKSLNNLRGNLELRSPIDGVVTGRYYDAGDVFSMTPNQSGSAGILQIMQINPLKVTVAVSEQYFSMVKLGMGVDINVETLADETFMGKVSLIYPSIDPATRTFKVEVTINNKDGKLRPGMYSKTTLKFGKQNGIIIDDLSVQKQYGTNEKYVYIVKDGKVERRVITTGRQIGTKVNVLTGISVADQVVTSGMSKLSDGVEIEVKNK